MSNVSAIRTLNVLEVDDEEFRIVTLALGHMAKPELIKPRGDDRSAAWELNKKVLFSKQTLLANRMKSVQDALKKVDAIEKENTRETTD